MKFEPVSIDDFDELLALRLRAMRVSLERLGRYDEQRARERLAAGFDAKHSMSASLGSAWALLCSKPCRTPCG